MTKFQQDSDKSCLTSGSRHPRHPGVSIVGMGV